MVLKTELREGLVPFLPISITNILVQDRNEKAYLKNKRIILLKRDNYLKKTRMTVIQ